MTFARSLLGSVLAVLLWAPAASYANDAEIIQLVGKGDARDTADAPWRPAAVKQKLVAGSFVRTGEMSQMGLLLRDRTQVRLNQLSILNIKAVNPTTPPPPTQLELNQGRAWSQAKPKQGPDVAARKLPTLEVSTPAAVATIRGTDWEIVVEKDGTSTVTVLSGEVEFRNLHGGVSVLPNEQARAVPGKAPVKILLTNAAERVQWVTAYRPQPRRWVKDLSGGLDAVVSDIEKEEFPAASKALAKLRNAPAVTARASLLFADLQIFFGEVADAIKILSPLADDGRGDPMATALLARAYLVAGRIADAGRVLDNAKQASHVELLLARAEYARVQGNEPEARRALLEVIRLEPNNAEAWYGIGRIETEREYVRAAREALNRAIQLQPQGAGYHGELATLETFANEFAAAEKSFTEALARQPDDYVALTGLGVLQLKRGEAQAALESFLKAGLIEPRYARAWLFSAAAYYQLGERGRADEALAKASSLDDKDPLPYLMRSQIHFDALELGRAIEVAREAQARMPFVKSLNQVLTDQKGSANVGSSLAAFGLEEWSQAYAYNSYSPYWSGSHLFLSDRFDGTFNRNSELFKGFLSDPSVFGASNRYSSLVPVPGHYGSIGATGNRDYITEYGVNVALNGYSTAWKPFSYSFAAEKTDGDSSINRTDADGRMEARGENLVLGVGMRPTHEIGVFAFGTTSSYDGVIADRASGLTSDRFSYDYKRFDVGLNYKFSPTSQAWLKAGTGTEVLPVSGEFFSQSTADALNAIFGPVFTPNGQLRQFGTDLSQDDIQFRHTFDLTPAAQLSWGLEYAKSRKPFVLSVDVPTIAPPLALRINLSQDNRIEAGTAYFSGRFRLSDAFEGQLDLHYQETEVGFSTDQNLQLVAGPVIIPLLALPRAVGEHTYRELNPRVGVKWKPDAAQTVRVAGQIWRKPAAVSTLGPVDTVGIPLDDRIERDGGRLKRARLQHEIEHGRSTFFQWFADWKEIKNPDAAGAGIVPDLELEQLQSLRNRKRVYGIQQFYLEDTPKFGAGEARSLGVAANWLVSREIAVAGRYIYADTENTRAPFLGLAIPYHPRNYFNAALNWQPYARWVVGPVATYRSSRYADEANTEYLSGGATFGLHAYWESTDKRWSLAGVVNHIHSDKQSSIYKHPAASLQAVFRF